MQKSETIYVFPVLYIVGSFFPFCSDEAAAAHFPHVSDAVLFFWGDDDFLLRCVF